MVHDGLWSYWQDDQGEHARCNAHQLRESTFVQERLKHAWAEQLRALLLEIKPAADRARADGLPALPSAAQRDWVTRYERLVAAGLRLNPAAPPTDRKQGLPILASLADAFRGQPPVPALA